MRHAEWRSHRHSAADDTVSNCCRHLVFAPGRSSCTPEQAEQMRQARAYMRRPGPAAFGLTEAAYAGSGAGNNRPGVQYVANWRQQAEKRPA